MKKLGFLVLAVVIAGCTGDDDDDTFSGDTLVEGLVESSTLGGDAPLAGATVEAVGGGPSTTTAADGTYSLLLTSSQNLTLRASAATHWGMQVRTRMETGTGFDFALPHDDLVTALGSAVGVTADTTKGLVAVNFITLTASSNIVATLSQPNAGSFTFSSSGAPVISDRTLPNGDPVLIFVNVDPGTTTVTVTSSGSLTCADVLGEANVPVDAKTLSLGAQFCQ